MKYQATLDYLYRQLPMFHRVGGAAYKANLDNTNELSALLGHPEKFYPSVHIAGTNGKGSCSHFIASILMEAGYKTGLFTSPHLRDFRERIRVNGKMIPKQEVSSFVETHQEAFTRIQPSFFEWTFALASEYFRKSAVDIAVFETGMGGRLDSTNIIQPLISIITNIGMDHMQFLGNTPEAIATEKAGIIKPGIPVVIGETQTGPDKVFINTAAQHGSKIVFADQLYRVERDSMTQHRPPLLQLCIESSSGTLKGNYLSPLTGAYQKKNLLTVLQGMEVLIRQGVKVSPEQVRAGIRKVIRNTGFSGRWQILSQKPLIIADIGHNPDGIRQVVSQLNSIPYRQLHIVLGVVNDKDIVKMLELLPAQARYYFCKANIPRGMDADSLRFTAAGRGLTGESYASVKAALQTARQEAHPEDCILVSGSAFVVAEVL